MMPETAFYSFTQIFESWATIIGIFGAGFWALYTFVIKRINKSAIDIDLKTTSFEYDNGRYIVLFESIIKNRGHIKLKAKYKCSPKSPYDPEDETGEFYNSALDLKIRPFPNNCDLNSIVYWYPCDPTSTLELDLLNLYRDYPNSPSPAYFWMEPGEEYQLGIPVILSAGLYLAKITFIGKKKLEFWSRLFLVNIPQSNIFIKSETQGISVHAVNEAEPAG
jgi:hypothetical protein